jgi:RimJ/RimL family protein N-acetyltransferase
MDLRIRATVLDDIDVLFAHQDDPVANEMAAFPARDRAAFEEHIRSVIANPDGLAYTILADGTVVGRLVSWNNEGHREIGYWIGREHWGRGYATAALRLFLEIERTRPLIAYAAVDNLGSRKVAERCGFVLSREEESEGVPYAVYERGEA